MLTDTPSHSAWSESRMGQKLGDFRCHVKQQKHVGNVFSRCRHTATKLAGLASFAPISDPSDVAASTSPQPYGVEGPNLAHLQHIVRSRGHCKQFANIRQRLGYTLAQKWAKMARLQIWHFFPGGPAPCRGPLPPNLLCHFVDPLELYKALNSQVSSSYHLQKHRN